MNQNFLKTSETFKNQFHRAKYTEIWSEKSRICLIWGPIWPTLEPNPSSLGPTLHPRQSVNPGLSRAKPEQYILSLSSLYLKQLIYLFKTANFTSLRMYILYSIESVQLLYYLLRLTGELHYHRKRGDKGYFHGNYNGSLWSCEAFPLFHVIFHPEFIFRLTCSYGMMQAFIRNFVTTSFCR